MPEGFLQRVERAGADVAEHHTDRADDEGRGAGAAMAFPVRLGTAARVADRAGRGRIGGNGGIDGGLGHGQGAAQGRAESTPVRTGVCSR